MILDALGPLPPYDLTDKREVRRVERMYDLHARKSFSQHWLVDRAALDAIVTAAEITRASTILEVGAGLGVLTAELGRRAGRVVAVEIERDVMPVLKTMTKDYPQVEIINSDLLKIDPATVFGDTPYTIAANLPYAITAKALRHFLEATHKPQRLVVLVQKEVAERITAKPGELSMLAISVQFYGTPRIIAAVPASSFFPPPKVDSAIIVIDVVPQELDPAVRDRLFALAKATFAQRRKQLHNTMPGALHLSTTQVHDWLAAVNISPERRPQTLSMAEWIALAETDPRVKGYAHDEDGFYQGLGVDAARHQHIDDLAKNLPDDPDW